VMQLPDLALRQTMLARLATGLADADARAGVTLAVLAIGDGPERDRAIVSAVQRWAQRDPESAADWVSQFQEGPLRDEALDNLLCQWARQDRDGAAKWLGQLPVGSFRNAGLSSYARQVAPEDRGAALEWADQITDERLRAELQAAITKL
jgi:hypothetical protein